MKWSMKWVVFVFALGLNINSDAMAYGSVQVKYDIDGRQFAVFYRVLQHEDHTHALTPDFQKQTEESFVRRGESFCFDHQCRYVEGQTKEHQQQYVSLQHSYSGGQWPHQESLVEDDEPRNLLQQTSDALAKFLDTYAKVVQTKASYMLWDLPPDFFQLHAILLDIKINTDAGEIVSFQYSMQADSSLFPKHDVLFGLHTQRRELIGEEEIDSAYTGQKWV
ncbi:MAG: hypothetical protein KDK51_05820, partial [Deltaproteobacteria bacterium]|nr:hypothetical protein [Deltaproteobacteria bacterium]